MVTAHQHQKQFDIAVCDQETIDLYEDWGVDFYKVLSKDFAREDFIRDLLQTGKTVFLSTGTSGEDEIQEMVGRLGNWKDAIKLIHTQISYDIRDVNLRRFHGCVRRMGFLLRSVIIATFWKSFMSRWRWTLRIYLFM